MMGCILVLLPIHVRPAIIKLTPICTNHDIQSNGTGCIPCPRNMKYSLTEQICVCDNTTLQETLLGCFTTAEIASTNNLGMSASKYYNNLKYVHDILCSCCLRVRILVIWDHVRNWLICVRTRWGMGMRQIRRSVNFLPQWLGSKIIIVLIQRPLVTVSTYHLANSPKTNRSA